MTACMMKRHAFSKHKKVYLKYCRKVIDKRHPTKDVPTIANTDNAIKSIPQFSYTSQRE